MGDPEEMGGNEEEQPKGGKGKLMIIIGVVLVLLVVMLAAAFMIFKGNQTDESVYDTEASDSGPENAVMIALPGAFTSILPPDGTDILTVEIVLLISPNEARGFTLEDAKEEFAPLSNETESSTKMPYISEAISTVLASNTRQMYISEVGLQQIRFQIQSKLNKVLQKSKVVGVIFPKPPLIQ